MTISDFGFRISDWRAALVGLLAVIGPSGAFAEIVLEEKRGDIEARAVIDRESVELSGGLTLTISVKGPGRVEVELPRPLLTKDSDLVWKVTEVGLPTVQVEKDWSLWKQVFQLVPYDEGPKLTIELAPMKVSAGNQKQIPLTWMKSAEVVVKLTIGEDRMLKDVTDIEKLPPAPPLFTPRPKPLMLVGLAISIVAIVGVIIIVLLRRKKPEEAVLTGAPRALRDLAALKQTRTGEAADFARAADVLRLYLEERWQIPAARLTTAEALDGLRKNHPDIAEWLDPLQSVLARCDLAKFAGAVSASEFDDCINQSIAFVEQSAAHSADTTSANPH